MIGKSFSALSRLENSMYGRLSLVRYEQLQLQTMLQKALASNNTTPVLMLVTLVHMDLNFQEHYY